MTKIIDSEKHTEFSSSWESIDWPRIQEAVTKLRGSIFKAKKSGKSKVIRRFQDIMLRSKANILLSIRQVTSINVGRRTPGLDKMLIKTNSERWNLYQKILGMSRKEWIDIAKPVL